MTIVKGCRKDVRVGVLTLHIKNAFNMASWSNILRATSEKNIPPYLCRVLEDYFRERTIRYNTDGHDREERITSGVPQGSVLGPTLWNILYDGLLREELPDGVEFLAYADDLALIGKSIYTFELERMLSTGAQIVKTWLAQNGLELAVEKYEAINLTNTRVHNEFSMKIGETCIEGAKSIKYLGMYLNSKLSFTEHAKHIAVSGTGY